MRMAVRPVMRMTTNPAPPNPSKVFYGNDSCNASKITWCQGTSNWVQIAGGGLRGRHGEYLGNEASIEFFYQEAVILVGVPKWCKQRQALVSGDGGREVWEGDSKEEGTEEGKEKQVKEEEEDDEDSGEKEDEKSGEEEDEKSGEEEDEESGEEEVEETGEEEDDDSGEEEDEETEEKEDGIKAEELDKAGDEEERCRKKRKVSSYSWYYHQIFEKDWNKFH